MTSAYADLHQVEGIGEEYDRVIYEGGGHDDFIWSLERQWLTRRVSQLRARIGRVRYLDFACGTGRVTSVVEGLVDVSTAVDISPFMVEPARGKLTRTTVVVANLLTSGDAVASAFDLITAFRFFRNTEPDMRVKVMQELTRRLDGTSARLIFNVHGNRYSSLGLTSFYRRLRGWEPLGLLSYREVRKLTSQAGLDIVEWTGFGLLPRRVHRGSLRRVAPMIDGLMSGRRLARAISQDLVFVCRLKDHAA